jgi:hypothetical protein
VSQYAGSVERTTTSLAESNLVMGVVSLIV